VFFLSLPAKVATLIWQSGVDGKAKKGKAKISTLRFGGKVSV
jgi:hypothetical protein